MSEQAACCAECIHYVEGNLMPEACNCDKPYCEPIKKTSLDNNKTEGETI